MYISKNSKQYMSVSTSFLTPTRISTSKGPYARDPGPHTPYYRSASGRGNGGEVESAWLSGGGRLGSGGPLRGRDEKEKDSEEDGGSAQDRLKYEDTASDPLIYGDQRNSQHEQVYNYLRGQQVATLCIQIVCVSLCVCAMVYVVHM